MINRFRLLTGVFLCVGLAGCGGGEKPPEPVSVTPPTETLPPPATPPVESPPTPPAMTETAPPMPPAGEMPPPTADAATPPAVDPATGMPLATGEGAPPVPARPTREVDPEFLKQLQDAAALSGPADHNNALARLGKAMQDFAAEHGHFPTIDGPGETGSPTGLSWRVALLPYLGYKELYDKFALTEAWDSPQNLMQAAAMPPVFGQQVGGKTRYHLITGPGAPFAAGTGPKPADFTDGMANTLMIVEAGPDKAEVWTRPGGLLLDAKRPAACLGNIDGSFTAVTADGVVCTIPVELEYLAAILQPADRQVVPADFDQYINKPATAPEWAAVEIPESAPAPEGNFSADYLPTTASGVMILSPRRIWESPLIQQIVKQASQEGETPEHALQRMMSAGGSAAPFNPAMIEEIRVVLNDKSASGASPYSPGPPGSAAAGAAQPEGIPPGVSAVVLRTAGPLPVGVLLPEMAKDAQQVNVEVVEGVPYVRLQGLPQSLAFPSDHELVIARDEDIETIVNAPPATAETSPVMAKLASMGQPMFTFVAAAPNGGKFEGMQTALQAAGPVALMVPQLAEMTALQFSLDLQADTLMELALTFPQEMQAQTLAQFVQRILQQSRGSLTGGAADSPQTQLINSLITGLEIQPEGTQLRAKMKRPEQLDEVVTMLQPQLAAARELGRSVEDLPPAERVARALQAYVAEHGHLPAANGPGDEEEKETTGKPDAAAANITNDFDPAAQLPAELRGANRAEAMRKLAGRTRGEEKSSAADNKNRGLSWRVYLLPYLGEKRLYDQFNLSERWDSPHNKALLTQMPAVFGEDTQGKTRLHLIVGNETLFKSGKAPDLMSVKDDPAETLLLVETGNDKAEFWTKPGGLPFDPKNPTRCLGKPNKEQPAFQAIMLDFTTREIPVEISPEEFRGLVQPGDGKPGAR